MSQLLEKRSDAPDTLRFATAHGLSENHFKWLDMSDTRERLGYAPQDDLTAVNPRLKRYILFLRHQYLEIQDL